MYQHEEEPVVSKTAARRSERITCAVLKIEDPKIENLFPELTESFSKNLKYFLLSTRQFSTEVAAPHCF